MLAEAKRILLRIAANTPAFSLQPTLYHWRKRQLGPTYNNPRDDNLIIIPICTGGAR